MFKRILVANRGEIAVRIIRTCREMGIETVALFSDADANALHIVLADYAANLPGSSPAETYLNIEAIIAIGKKYKVDALHPGYGFLSENPLLAEACDKANIKFIGPSAQAIRDLGNKVKAKELAQKAGTPISPGTEGAVDGVEGAKAFAEKAGFPLMLKAAAGGGGRGIRVVKKLEEMEKAFISCQNEARGAFGDDSIFIERYIENPKHIEFQILADEHGNVIHLGERDCSVQRRHQKLIEEAPSPALTPELREEMGRASVALAREAGYANAGTVEYLLDSSGNFYFMEMNTRLQVEHPVTEQITGVDLVRQQILVASGRKLEIRQEDVEIRGWAFEARINAEDAYRGFMPALGRINRYIPPQGPGIRLDSCAYEGFNIPSQYDSMVAKLITYGPDRETAVKRMQRALNEFIVTGVRTTIPFHDYVFSHPVFQGGDFTTSFVEDHFSEEQVKKLVSGPQEGIDSVNVAIAAALKYYLDRADLITSNQADDREAGRRWSIVNRLANTSYIPN